MPLELMKPRHLTLSQRRVLSSHLQVLRAFSQPGLDFKDVTLRDRLAEGSLQDATLGHSSGHQLDDFVKDHVNGVKSKLKRVVSDPILVDSLVPILNEAATEIRCGECSSVVCTGPDDAAVDDDLVVAGGGQCIQAISEIFEWVKEEALKVYDETVSQKCSPNTVDIAFSTLFMNQLPTPNYAIGGATKYHDQMSSLGSEIRLILAVDLFDWSSYLAIPAILFHELIVHAFQGAHGTSGRSPVSSEDQFSEGWMDLVAYELAKRALLSRAGEINHQHQDHARFLFSLKQTSRPSHFETRQGCYAATMFLEYLKSNHPQASETLFYQFSLELNLMPLPAEEKNVIVTLVKTFLEQAGTDQARREGLDRLVSSLKAGDHPREYLQNLVASNSLFDIQLSFD